MASLQAAGTSYATHGEPMIPFYIFYSMFGFQRTGDQVWAFGDAARPRLPDGRHGRPDDARRRGPPARRRPHATSWRPRSRTSAPTTRPSPTSWRRSSATASSGCTRDGEDVFYYVTLYNENYPQPAEARRRRRGRSCAGIYRFAAAPDARQDAEGPRSGSSARARSCSRSSPPGTCSPSGSASRPRSTRATSFQQLRRDALEVERWNRLHPDEAPRVPYVAQVLGADGGPIVVATDWMKALPDMVAPLGAGAVPRRSAPTGSAGATRARRCAALLRDRPAEHRGGRAVRARPVRRLDRRGGRGGDPRARHRPGRWGSAGRVAARRSSRCLPPSVTSPAGMRRPTREGTGPCGA